MPLLRVYLDALDIGDDGFADAFVGGGSVLIEMAQSYGGPLYANDADPNMHAFWQLVSDSGLPDGEFRTSVLLEPTVERFRFLRNREPDGVQDRAFYAVFFNRTTFSGIQTSGPIGGYEQKSKWKIDCRYNAAQILEDFDSLRKMMAGRLSVSGDDIAQFLSAYGGAVYLDPPYFEQGKQLYPVFMEEDEHRAMAEMLRSRDNWVLSYDNCPEILAMYDWAEICPLDARYSIRGNKRDWQEAKELVIFPRSMSDAVFANVAEQQTLSELPITDA